MGALLFVTAVVALLIWRAAMQDPEWGQAWPDRELPAPDREQALLAALGPLEAGRTLSLRVWSSESVLQNGARLTITGVCPQLAVATAGQGSDVEVGDAALDGALSLMGPPPLVRAMLDARTRRALLTLAASPSLRAGSLRVRDGELRLDLIGDDAETAVRIARLALTVAAGLQAPSDVPGRLAANAREDPQPSVRWANLEALASDFAGQPVTAAALHAAAADRDGDVRLLAARELGEEGRPILLGLIADESVDDSCSARAVDLLRDLPADRLAEIATAALRPAPGGSGPSRASTARACIEALARRPDEGAWPLLARAARSTNEVVARAAVEALERIGGPGAVVPLQDAARHQTGDLREAAAGALATVQARLTGEAGQISLAAGDSGQVSLAEDGAGCVSLPPAAPKPPAG